MKVTANKRFLLCIWLSFICSLQSLSAQEIILLDRKWKQPVQQVDTLTFALLQNGYFPVYKRDMDTMISILEMIVEKQVQQKKFKYLNPPLTLKGTEVVGGLSRRAKNQIFVKTTTGSFSTSMPLLTGDEAPTQKEKKLSQLLDYLKNNRLILE
jgi:hypothetical protein